MAVPRKPLDLGRARILLCNDDGIDAPGLALLMRVARGLTRDVWVVAPEQEQSGASHSLTLHRPLRIREIDRRRFAVDGTPSDCIVLALDTILKDKHPDLVLSGINSGANTGEDLTYSGTVAGAMEATLLGMRAIALSQATPPDGIMRWQTAAAWAAKTIEQLAVLPWPKETFYNVNFPDVPPHRVKGIVAAAMGGHKIGEHPTRRLDPRGRPYYWIGPQRNEEKTRPGTDVRAVAEGKVAVTPIFMDMTNGPALTRLRKALA